MNPNPSREFLSYILEIKEEIHHSGKDESLADRSLATVDHFTFRFDRSSLVFIFVIIFPYLMMLNHSCFVWYMAKIDHVVLVKCYLGVVEIM